MKYLLTVLLCITIGSNYLCADEKDLCINKEKEEVEIPLTEDLMREHGILNRVLLIYEEIIKRIDNNIDFSVTTLSHAIKIIQSFIEDYHEKMEEMYVFPLFEKHKKEIRLVITLKNQHDKGRKITAQLQKLTATDKLNASSKKSIKKLLQKFIRMYRPHEAREDTVLFPQVRSFLSEKEFKELGEKFDEFEHKLFGKNGFETIIKKVEDLEKDLGIYNLEQFTPKL